jgi:RecB family exonuclease
MLAAFEGWVRSSRADGLRLVAVEQPVQLDIAGDVPAAEPDGGPGEDGRRAAGPWLRLRGRVDRLEVDAEGRPVVIDIKTGKTAVSARAAAEHPQLAVYQLAAALGAFGELLEPGVKPGGARLVYLADQKAGGQAKEPVQPPLDDQELAGWEAVVRRCAEETSEAQFIARVGPDCDRCPVRTSCPLSESGRPVPDA